MPSAIDPSDRKLLLVAGAVMLALAAALAVVSPPPPDQANGGAPSIYSDGSGGARAAFLLLQALHRHVQPWERPPTDLPQGPEDKILILANPQDKPSKAERDALLQFVQSGGRVVFTGARIQDYFPDANSSDATRARQWATYHANLPSSYTRRAPTISLQPQSEWEGNNPAAFALYGDSDSPAVVSWSEGNGEILWWAGPTPLTNAGINREGNLNFFLDSVSDTLAAANAQPDIYWDEYFHGQRASLWGYFQKTPVPWGLLQLAVLGLAVLFTFSRRSGPTMLPPVVTRLAPLEFVDTLGGLYHRAHAEPAVVAAVYQGFRATVTRQLRLPQSVPDAVLEEAVRGRLGLKDSALLETLRHANAASRSARIRPADALDLVQKLENYEVQLGLKKKPAARSRS
ncbi:MAG: DUF4350 domain-containing protein [Candidatus Acidiferrales bacterium]